MHSFLVIGTNNLEKNIENLAAKLHARVMEFPLSKIEEVRNLNNLIRLSFEEPTLIVSKNINEATEEALNAFLKNLEEPQDNVYFALTSPSVKKVLPTVVSRCQIIIITSHKLGLINENTKEIEEFLNFPVGKKLFYINSVKDREKALELVNNSVNFLHSQLHENKVKYEIVGQNLELAIKTHSGLKGNGNVNLHLVNFCLNYQNG